MKKLYLVAVVLIALLAGCGDGIEPIVGKEVELTGKEFGTSPTYAGIYDVYTTSDTEWLIIFNDTEVVGGTRNNFLDLHPGQHVKYDAKYFDWLKDSQGFSHFTWFVDWIAITSE
jgi:hypothetical protein